MSKFKVGQKIKVSKKVFETNLRNQVGNITRIHEDGILCIDFHRVIPPHTWDLGGVLPSRTGRLLSPCHVELIELDWDE